MTMLNHVIKRDGKKEKISLDKITARINKLCYGLDTDFVDVFTISKKVIEGIFSGVTTVALDNLAAETCAMMSTIHPDYGILAARIQTNNIHKETKKAFSEVVTGLYKNFSSVTSKAMPMVSDTFYADVMANKDELDSTIVYDRDYQFSYFALKTLEKSYLLKIGDKIVERPQHMLMRTAVALHGTDLDAIKETYNSMSLRYFIHASPTLFNAGTMRGGLASCYLMALTKETDSIDGIFDMIKECASISKYSGGIGLSIHDVRAKGSIIHSTLGRSEGIIPMIKCFGTTAKYVTQSCKRPGSIAVYLEPWHAEIFEFLEMKKNTGKEEMRCRDLFYALWVCDLFMERVKEDGDWSLFCPNEAPGLSTVYGEKFETLYKKYEDTGMYREKIKARKLWNAILDSQIETGGPYILYKDAVNRKNNQAHIGTIRSSNLCVEIMEYTDEKETATCNLASIGLPAFVVGGKTKKFDYKMLSEKVRIVTRNLNKVIDKTHYPVEKAKYSNFRHRPIGIGVSGLSDTFAILRLPFESDEARKINKWIFETIYYAALDASCELAERDGAYETYDGSEFSKGNLQFDLWNVNTEHSGMWDWAALKARISKFGVRNSLLTAPMPTASTSQILGYSECFEPVNSNLYTRKVLSGEFQIVNKYLLDDLCKLNLWGSDMKDKIIELEGSVQDIPEIPENVRELYKTVWEVKQKSVITLAADRAVYVDQSQSLNIFMAKPTHASLSSMHFFGHSLGLKSGMYYLRSKPASKSLQFTVKKKTAVKKDSAPELSSPVCVMEEGCVSCSG